MKVVIAIDSFKGSLDSRGAGEAARAGVLAADPAAQVVVPPGDSPRPGKVSTPTPSGTDRSRSPRTPTPTRSRPYAPDTSAP